MPRKHNVNYQIDRRRTRKKDEINDTKLEDEYSIGDSIDDDGDGSEQASSNGSAQKSSSPRKKDDSGDEYHAPQEDEDSEDDELEFVATSRSRTTRRNSPRRNPAPKSRAKRKPIQDSDDENSGDDDDDDDDDEEEEEWQDNGDEEEEDDEDLPQNSQRSRAGTRASGRQDAASDDDEEEEDDFIPSSSRRQKTRPKPTPKRKRKRPPSRARQTKLDNFIVPDDVSLEELDSPSPAKATRSQPGSRRRPPLQRRRIQHSESDDHDSDDTSSKKRTNSRKRQASRQSRSKPTASLDFKSSDVDDDDDGEVFPTRSRSPRRAAQTSKKIYKEIDSDSESDDNDGNDGADLASSRGRRQRTPRFSAAKATAKLRELKDSEASDQDDDGHGESSPEKTVSPSKNTGVSSDEEFLDSSASVQSDEKPVFDSDTDDDDAVDPTPLQATNIDNEVIGSAEESSDDDDDEHKNGQTLRQLAGMSGTPNTARSPLETIHPLSKGVESSSDEEPTNTAKRLFSSPPKLPPCPSIEDAITNDPLPRRHVCYVTPDGSSRQCFALETLRQIALQSTILPFFQRTDRDQQEARSAFLQPPHFRTPMSDDLLDQIASRFGREALDVHGEFYRRKKEDLQLDRREFNVDANVVHDPFGAGFADRVNDYIKNQMGSKDVYACPLCYSEMHRRIVQMDHKRRKKRRQENNAGGGEIEDNSEDDETFLELPADSHYDPMTVLGWLDDDKYEAASSFCFSKVSALKNHLRVDHTVQTKGILGNDLYQRYRIRAQDGLLQRFLHREWSQRHCTTFQGAMQSYWLSGNNQTFIYLLEMMKVAENFRRIYEDTNVDDEEREEADDYFAVAHVFFQSIQRRVQLEWLELSSPFTKNQNKEDLKDFLAADSDVEDDVPHFLARREMVVRDADEEGDPNSLVNKIQRKYAENDDDDDSVIGSESEEESVTSELNRKSYYSESEQEEEDEWVTSLRKKKKGSKQNSQSSSQAPKAVKAKTVDLTTPVGKKLKLRKNKTPTSATVSRSTPSSWSSRRITIADDEDNGESSDESGF